MAVECLYKIARKDACIICALEAFGRLSQALSVGVTKYKIGLGKGNYPSLPDQLF